MRVERPIFTGRTKRPAEISRCSVRVLIERRCAASGRVIREGSIVLFGFIGIRGAPSSSVYPRACYRKFGQGDSVRENNTL